MNDIQPLEPAQAVTHLRVLRVVRLALRLAQFIGRAVSALIFVTLAVFEPLVRFVLLSLGLAGLFVTVVFGFLLQMEELPKWFMLGLCGSCFLILAMYCLAMRVFFSFGSRPI